MNRTDDDWEDLAFQLSTVFKPTSPVNREDLFAGRTAQVREVVNVINQSGQHAVLYGERGVGKTSLANMIFPKLYSVGLPKLAPLVNCVHDDTYSAIWRRVFREILFIAKQQGFDIPEQLLELIGAYTDAYADEITPDIVRIVLHELGQEYLVVAIMDEYDTLEGSTARRAISDTIKFLSDRNTPCTLVLVGVANDVEALVSDHQSVERCLSQIGIQRMSRDELEEIITRGLDEVGMKIARDSLHEISRISRGLPHYTHLLGLHAGWAAVDDKCDVIQPRHMQKAMKTAITKAQQTIQKDYSKATTSARSDATYQHTLLAAAMTETDELGYFYAKSIKPHLERISKKKSVRIDSYTRHLHSFCEQEKGSVLAKEDDSVRSRYRFRNPLLEPYVMIRGLASGLISEEDLRKTRDANDPQGRLF